MHGTRTLVPTEGTFGYKRTKRYYSRNKLRGSKTIEQKIETERNEERRKT
jgi:hypothetical protein